ncbi:F0F1 ATP synthase subunit B [Desulfotomaculum copahuensis]|uniref:ATP synthase subunit b n=1 Tax=Desulfotomaculum copahuensis TaxID=1838280 RepID=A0A1B7LB68_9FIRM|nr:F0F1 ATP synthase subunit B [Desulfotomaculum copahuensis]OAT79782.1 ATP synthase F0 subunit B [Desulfotomaculum copahuensis]
MKFNATLLAQFFHFILLLIFLRIVAYKPVANMLKSRQEFITNNVAAAEEDRKQAEALRQQYLADMQKAREEAQAIIQQATKAGEVQAQEIIEAAKTEANRVKDNALQEIAREKEKAVAELRDQVASLSVLVAGKIINQTITPEIQHGLVQDFIKEAGDLPC